MNERFIQLKRKWQIYEKSIIHGKDSKKLEDSEVKWLLQHIESLNNIIESKNNTTKNLRFMERERSKKIIDGIRKLQISPNLESYIKKSIIELSLKSIYQEISDDQEAIINVTKDIIMKDILEKINHQYWQRVDKLFQDIKNAIDGKGYAKMLGLE